MLRQNKILTAIIFAVLVFTFTAPKVSAGDKEYDAVVRHLKSKYQAKKVKIPFMWLARFAVKVVRPAGVKSFNVTLFENVNFSFDTLDAEMQDAMKNSLSADWSPIFKVRSREGQQAYMYMREADKDVKIMLVTMDKQNAAVIRAKFSPDKLAEFVNNPRIFGISLNDGDKQKGDSNDKKEEDETDKRVEETKKEG